MGTVGIIIIGLLLLLGILIVVYFLLLLRLKNIHSRTYKYQCEELLKEENVLIIYQPSKHKTIEKIVKLVKNGVDFRGYGTRVVTLSENEEDYSKYRYVIFIAPVYFGDVHNLFKYIASNHYIKNLIVIYNGVNRNSNNEDIELRKYSKNDYKKIKVYSDEIYVARDFVEKEVSVWKK